MANLLKWLGDAIGSAADAIIPGDQSSWHSQAPAPVAPPVPDQSRMAAANIGRGLGYGNSNSTLPYSPPMAAPTPQSFNLPKPKTQDLIDQINTMARIGPKAVAATRAAPMAGSDWQNGGSVEQSNGVQGTLQAIGQLPFIGAPVQVGNAINDTNDQAVANMKNGIPQYTPDMVLGGAARTGVANSPLGAAAQLFGGIANEFNKQAGLGDGTSYNPLTGGSAAFSNQAADQGAGATLLNNALNILGAVAPSESGGRANIGPTVGEAAKAINNEGGYVKLPGESADAAAERLQNGAVADKPHYIEAVRAAANDVGGTLPEGVEKNAVKGIDKHGNVDRTRMVDKINEKGRLTDPLRSTILIKDPADAPKVLQAMKQQGYEPWIDPKTGKPDITDRHQGRQPGDYTDVALKLVKHQGDPIIKELQLIQPNMYDTKINGGHEIFKLETEAKKLLGKTTDPVERTKLQEAIDTHKARQAQMYDAAYALDNPGLADRSTAAPMVASDSTSLASNGTPNLEANALRSASDLPPKNLVPTSASRNVSLENDMGSSPFNSTIAQNGEKGKGTDWQMPDKYRQQAIENYLAHPDAAGAKKTLRNYGITIAEAKAHAIVDTAYKKTLANGGVTISLKGKEPTDGIVFSPDKTTERVMPKAEWTPEHLDQFVADHFKELGHEGNHLGVWEDDGKIYMDVSQVGDKTPATLQKAMDAQQLGAFDLGSFENIPLGKINEKGYTALHEAANHPYFNAGKDSGANSAGGASQRAEVSGDGRAGVPDIPSQAGPPQPPTGSLGPKGKTTKYAGTTIPESEKVSKPIREQVKANAPTYKVAPEAEGLKSAAETIDRLGPDKAVHDVMERLDVPKGKISRQDAIDAQAVAAGLDARGGEVAHAQATKIYTKLSEHYTASGQLTQAAAMMARRTPEGLKYQAISDLRRAGVDITPELAAKIDQHIDNIKNAKDPKARATAVGKMKKTVVDAMPQNVVENIVGVWKAGMISGVKTQGGNLESNGMFGLMKKVSDLPATGLDIALSPFTGQRTKSATLRGIPSGAWEGTKKGVATMRTGFDERNVKGKADKYDQYGEINFGNKHVWQKAAQNVLGKPANFVFRGMAAADQPFHYGTLKNSLYDQAIADGRNQGLHGQALKAHMEQFVQDPPLKAADTALREATKSTLAHDTLVGVVVPAIKKGIDMAPGAPKGWKIAAKASVDALVPFSKIPAGFLSRTIDFTPLGVGREVITQIFNRKKGFDQRAFVQAVGEGLTGTGVIAVGMQLANGGLLSGDYPKNDPKKVALWKAKKITPNSLNVGGTWISLNYLGPVGLLFGMGKNMVDAKTNNTGSAIGAALAGLGSGLLNQSFLQGFSNFTDAIKNPQQFAQTFKNSEAGSLIPAWSNDIANFTDEWQRQTNTAGEAIMARIPVVRENLDKKIDTFGHDLAQGTDNPLNTASPLRPSTEKDDPMLNEIDRLAGVDQAVIPLPVKTIGQGDTAIKLTPQQQTQRQKLVGQSLEPLWNQIMASPSYQALTDAYKHQALQAALTDVNEVVNRKLTAEIDSSKLTKPATGTVADILSGNPPTAQDYIDRANKAQQKANGTTTTTTAKKTTSRAKTTGTKKVATRKTTTRKLALPRMPSARSFNAHTANSAIAKLLGGTGKAFHTAKIAKSKTRRHTA
jgi:hypothetical protein